MVALATTLTNQRTERRKANAKQITNHGPATHIDELPLIALTLIRYHALNKNTAKASN